jgi:flagellar hook assembly protein FlgD
LPKQSIVTIDIFDILGHKVKTISEGTKPAGNHEAIWDAGGQASGMYFYKIKAGQFSDTKKMLLVK